jgi:hypothetical protein
MLRAALSEVGSDRGKVKAAQIGAFSNCKTDPRQKRSPKKIARKYRQKISR